MIVTISIKPGNNNKNSTSDSPTWTDNKMVPPTKSHLIIFINPMTYRLPMLCLRLYPEFHPSLFNGFLGEFIGQVILFSRDPLTNEIRKISEHILALQGEFNVSPCFDPPFPAHLLQDQH